VIHSDLVIVADAMVETLELAERTDTVPEMTAAMVPLFAAALAHTHRELLVWLWRHEQ
jgi:hypothetical protein